MLDFSMSTNLNISVDERDGSESGDMGGNIKSY